MLQDILWAALVWTAEYQNFGLNAMTVSAVMMLVLTVVETNGLVQQGRTIWRMKSAESVETELFLYTFPFFILCGIYGFYLHSVCMMLNCGITAVVQIKILRGLVEFRGFSEREQRLGSAYALMPVFELMTTHWTLVYVLFSFGCWWAFYEQLRKLRRVGKTGAVDIWMYVSYLISSVAWTFYACATGEIWFMVAMGGITAIIVAIIVVWCRLRAKEPSPPRLLQLFARP